jgi:PTS system mannose-specific IIC component/fructoselysine and glucoselysine-specific PTS system IIC component
MEVLELSTITAALVVTLIYWLLKALDPMLLSWQCLGRPIVAAPLVGLVLGDFQTGIIMGASLEAIFMGISAVGGSLPSDPLAGTVISVSYIIMTGSDLETGLAIALPIGTLMASLGGLFMSLFSALAPYWERLAVSGKPKTFLAQNIIFSTTLMQLPGVIVLFLGLAFGVEGLNATLGALPPFVMTGLGAASGMMIGIGFAILTSMIWSKEVGYFFIVGYVLTKVVALDTLYVAIIGAAIAITIFLNDKKLIDMKKSLVLNTGEVADEEEFF